MDHSVIFHPKFAQNFFINKLSKNKVHTWNKHLLSTRNGNLEVKSTILLFFPNLPKIFFNFKMTKIEISKMSKIKIRIWEKHPWNLVNVCFWFLKASLVQKNVLEGLKVHLMKIILLSYRTRKSQNKQKKIKTPCLVTRKFYVE